MTASVDAEDVVVTTELGANDGDSVLQFMSTGGAVTKVVDTYRLYHKAFGPGPGLL